MTQTLMPIVAGIVLEGMKILSVIQHRKLMKEHKLAMEDVANAENKVFPIYTDAELDLANERLRIFLEAYWSELRQANVASMQSGEGRS